MNLFIYYLQFWRPFETFNIYKLASAKRLVSAETQWWRWDVSSRHCGYSDVRGFEPEQKNRNSAKDLREPTGSLFSQCHIALGCVKTTTPSAVLVCPLPPGVPEYNKHAPGHSSTKVAQATTGWNIVVASGRRKRKVARVVVVAEGEQTPGWFSIQAARVAISTMRTPALGQRESKVAVGWPYIIGNPGPGSI